MVQLYVIIDHISEKHQNILKSHHLKKVYKQTNPTRPFCTWHSFRTTIKTRSSTTDDSFRSHNKKPQRYGQDSWSPIPRSRIRQDLVTEMQHNILLLMWKRVGRPESENLTMVRGYKHNIANYIMPMKQKCLHENKHCEILKDSTG